jgi:sugar lactone lactonase YvrE
LDVIDPFSEPIAFHGEGPVWTDSLRTLEADGRLRERRHVGAVAAALRPRREGGLVVALERGFALVGPDGAVEVLPEVWSDPGVRMNDGATDPHGRFYCGSMAYDMAPGAGALYRLDPDGEVSLILSSVSCSNGLAWSPDHTTAYYVDSLTYRVDAFDYDGELSNRRPFATIDRDHGMPDGLTVDSEGGIWVALWGGSAVRRYGPDGALDEVLTRPVTQVTAGTFVPSDPCAWS